MTVVPAQAGTPFHLHITANWIPACAGMTESFGIFIYKIGPLFIQSPCWPTVAGIEQTNATNDKDTT
jgi:hypothetical protein